MKKVQVMYCLGDQKNDQDARVEDVIVMRLTTYLDLVL